MPDLALWTLNRATQLIATRRRENKVSAIFPGDDEFVFGRRAGEVGTTWNFLESSAEQVVADGSALHAASARTSANSVQARHAFAKRVVDSFEHRLMHESPTLDEYFVPIPVKALGDPRRFLTGAPPLGLAPTAEGRTVLGSIMNSPANPYFAVGNEAWLEEYWQTGQRDFLAEYPKVRMNTDPARRCGYYELLTEFSEQNGDCQHILVGYSQGGLVARYLAWLDHHVFGRNLIRGVITVGAPNAGSPLANPANNHSVVNGILQMVLAVGGMSPERNPATHEVLRGTVGHGVEDFARVMDAMILDAEARGDADRKSLESADGLRSLRKWMTGIVRDSKTAFANLNIADFGEPGSVLGLLDRLPTPPRCYFGSIIHANQGLDDLLKPIIPLVRFVDLEPAGKVYARYVMSENGDVDHDRAQQLIASWERGIDRGAEPGRPSDRIDPYDHDFIIPSTRMLSEGPNLLRNLVNPKANHLTGGSYAYGAGRQNFKLILELLDHLKVRTG